MAYVVIYDVPTEIADGQDGEHYYGYFATPDEASKLFWTAFAPHEVRNVKLCQIVEQWPTPADET